MPGFAVDEVDPTGAGDCFGAAFVSFWLRGAAPAEALRIANACGALAVTRKGPMEGIFPLAEVEAFVGRAGKASHECRDAEICQHRGAGAPPARKAASPRSARRIRWSSRPPCATARRGGADVLIEATCNQVNHEGGYTGMTPAGFRAFVEAIAEQAGFPLDRLILGGDHLGPNPWKHLPAAERHEEGGRR